MAERFQCGNFVHYFPDAERCVCGQQEGHTLVPPSEYHAVLRRLEAAEAERDRLRADLMAIGDACARNAAEFPVGPLRDAWAERARAVEDALARPRQEG